MIRVLFLGTPDFAAPSLERLEEADRLEVVGVITQPDRPAGRGRKRTAPPIKRIALKHGLPLLQPPRIRDHSEAHEFARQACPDVMAVVAFGQLLPDSFFELPPHGALNVHASLLPRYRGAAPIAHALLNGERETGVTIMKIDAGLDSGDIVAVRKLAIGPNVTAGELSEQLARLGAELLIETIPRWVAGEIRARAQDHDRACHAPRLDKKQAPVDWNRPAEDIHNHIRALNPWPVATARFRGETLKLWTSRNPSTNESASASPGTIVAVSEAGIRVAAGRGVLDLVEVQPPNRRRMSALDFANGRRIQIGEQFNGQ